jgi:hypothetical protein
MALATAFTMIGIASDTMAGDKAELVAGGTQKWTVRSTADRDVRIETSDGIVLEAHKLRFRLPSGDNRDAPRWCSITCQPDGMVTVITVTEDANGTSERSAICSKALVLRFHPGSLEFDVVPVSR